MKNLNLLVWMTQLGLSVALPLAGFVWLGLWLKNSCGWGLWSLIVCMFLGLLFAVDGLRHSLQIMNRMAKEDPREAPGVSFNDHE